MREDEREAAHRAALAMLEAFTRSGANKFDLTITTAQGEKVRFRPHVLREDLRRALPALLDEGARKEQNIIVRPRGPGTQFIQLDDLNADRMEKVLPATFLALETSPGNFQAWTAISDSGADADFARRLRKGAEADPSASGATRVAGSKNFKDKYAPDFPTVQIAHCSPGLIITPEQLAAMGLVATPEKAAQKAAAPLRAGRIRPGPGVRRWPDYARCLQARAAQLQQYRPGRKPRRFCMEHDGDRLGMEH